MPPAGQPYGQYQHGQPPYGQPPYGQSYGSNLTNYAGWGSRVAATIIDGLISFIFLVPGFILLIVGASAESGPLLLMAVLLYLAGIVFYYIKYCTMTGTTGQSWGRKQMGYKIVDEHTGQPIGAWKVFGRQIVGGWVDGIFMLGYLWPLWDVKKQKWSDKIFGTVAVQA